MSIALDEELVAAATAAVTGAYDPERHFVGAAIRTTGGAVYTGVNLQAYVTRISVCAEPIALGQAVLAGDGEVARAVAVFHPKEGAPVVCSPCGMCRELLGDYGATAEIIVPGGLGPTTMGIAELLPNKYTREPT